MLMLTEIIRQQRLRFECNFLQIPKEMEIAAVSFQSFGGGFKWNFLPPLALKRWDAR